VLFLSWARKNITTSVQLLEKGVVDFAGRSHGQRNLEQLKFEEPEIKTDNEVRSLSKAITKMTEDMRDYVHDIISAEKLSHDMKELADTMSDLAVVDSLTGIWNKTAYMREINNLQKELAENPDMPAGLAMIDLNYLKLINDTKGHEKGDEALQNVAKVASEVFFHSPVFRLGGDEFAVILLGEDYDKADELLNKFVEKASGSPDDEPWKKISASIGIAKYDKNTDQSLDDVLKRADQNMYEMKKKMRAERSS
jgi:diguanylate cyclase (GGDEF)-like protein